MQKSDLVNEIEQAFYEKKSINYRYNIFAIMSECLSISDLKEMLNYIREME